MTNQNPDPNPVDIALEINGDLVIQPNGDIALVNGWDKVRQRILRRLFTNPKLVLADGTRIPSDYYFDTSYGIGIARLLGQPFTEDFRAKFQQKVKAAVLIDEGIDVTQDPKIEYFTYAGDSRIYAQITVYLINNQPQRFQILAAH